jgi:1-deoxy-D-xylulose-5-phosphate synthase
MVVPGMFFEDMGIKYLGPIDGHNIKELTEMLGRAKNIKGPVILHVVTQKGKGYEFAEKNPCKFHAMGPFRCDSGELCFTACDTYSKAFGDEIVELAEKNKDIVGITAAMKDGTGLTKFAEKFPNRFFDVGIAEQHAVTLAAGMSREGLKPIFAVYSTFLQRAYDQLLHDICIQNLPVIIAIDRAGIVGDDGETHQGVFDLSFLTHMPNMTVVSPKCIPELKYMLKWAVNQSYPIAIRYPRGGDNANIAMEPLKNFTLGKWEVINNEGKIALIAQGKMVQHALLVRKKLAQSGISVRVINACFVKPLDKKLLKDLVDEGVSLVNIEDNVLRGGLGSYILEYVNSLDKKAKVLNLGFKDEFIPHGKTDILYRLYELDTDGIIKSILKIV